MRSLASINILRSFLLGCAGACILGATVCAGAAAPVLAATNIENTKTNCVYSAHEISILDQFDQMVGQQINCAMVYNNVSTTWDQWEHPWFVNYASEPNYDWSAWATAPGTKRQLVITQNLIPSDLLGTPWLRDGAAGDFTAHATQLAENLVL